MEFIGDAKCSNKTYDPVATSATVPRPTNTLLKPSRLSSTDEASNNKKFASAVSSVKLYNPVSNIVDKVAVSDTRCQNMLIDATTQTGCNAFHLIIASGFLCAIIRNTMTNFRWLGMLPIEGASR